MNDMMDIVLLILIFAIGINTAKALEQIGQRLNKIGDRLDKLESATEKEIKGE